MNNEIDKYLLKVDRYLKPMSKSEREDIILEIRSEISELEKVGNSCEDIISRLGEPKKLAKAYIEDGLIDNDKVVSNVRSVIAYVLLVGFGGVFTLPCTMICGIAFFLSGILCPAAGIIKFVAYLFGNDIQNIQFEIGNYSASAFESLPISFVMGLLLLGASYSMWKISIKIIKSIAKGVRK